MLPDFFIAGFQFQNDFVLLHRFRKLLLQFQYAGQVFPGFDETGAQGQRFSEFFLGAFHLAGACQGGPQVMMPQRIGRVHHGGLKEQFPVIFVLLQGLHIITGQQIGTGVVGLHFHDFIIMIHRFPVLVLTGQDIAQDHVDPHIVRKAVDRLLTGFQRQFELAGAQVQADQVGVQVLTVRVEQNHQGILPDGFVEIPFPLIFVRFQIMKIRARVPIIAVGMFFLKHMDLPDGKRGIFRNRGRFPDRLGMGGGLQRRAIGQHPGTGQHQGDESQFRVQAGKTLPQIGI